ncbi:MAG: rhamnogalacturonan acetylesterase [Aristaeellaceae bacterium]
MTIYICGDSTAASYEPEKAPITGWGQVLGEYLPGVEIANHAMAGRSSKSFLAEGRLIPIEKAIQPGDLLLIQFTHNDRSDLTWRHTEPEGSFRNTLSIFVDTARIHGAIPVLMTPIPLRQWENGELVDTHGDYPAAIRRLAKEKDVPLLEITLEGMQALRDIGEEAAKPLYMNFDAGLYPAYPNGSKDDVHTQRPGAALYARITAAQLKAQGLV